MPPLYLLDREKPYRPSLVAWIELPEGLVVGQGVVMPEDVDGAVGRVLREALAQPTAGAPRRPDAIRVADSIIAAEVRGRSGAPSPSRSPRRRSSTTCAPN